ncbi:hypothetical protein NQZ68_028748 [Dissostichus eleginoides]|nr:hypothetical protein NQZ68_028748 [Dissostichus eleginoides]
MGDMWSGLESSLKAAEGLFPVGQPLRDCADLLKLPPAGQQSVWKPGHSVWHRAGEQAAPDCDGFQPMNGKHLWVELVPAEGSRSREGQGALGQHSE